MEVSEHDTNMDLPPLTAHLNFFAGPSTLLPEFRYAQQSSIVAASVAAASSTEPPAKKPRLVFEVPFVWDASAPGAVMGQSSETAGQRTRIKRGGLDGLRHIETHKYVLIKSRALRPATPLLNVATPFSANPKCRRMRDPILFWLRWLFD